MAELTISAEVRLGWNEYSRGEGRVEIFYFNRWGTVCNTTWDITDSNVVCRQLGFWRAFATVDSIVFGATPSGPVWLDKTNCSGEEDSLYRCRKAGVGGNQCQHETVAAVICDLTGQLLVGHTGGERRPLLYYNISDSSGFHERSAINVSAITMLYHKEETTLYWIQDVEGSSKNCELRRINVNGSNNQWETFATLTFCNQYSSVTIDEIKEYIFWTEPSTSRRVYRKATDGSSLTVFRYGVQTPRGLALRKATRRVYILMENRVDSRTLNLGGPTSPVSYPNNKNVKCLTLDEAGGMMYFIDFEGDAVLKMAPIDGGKLKVVPLDIKDTPSGMLFASGWLVWLEPTHHRVGRVALRGSSREIIYQDFDEQMEAPASLAFIP
ncbi:uncharacterized protein LOC129280353 [Lytechinus pictus]|uniref:uncharacterized protein LOC129280353 n=1 Tax=Lytechinus pictus TaxID=7653 RepID=UPI0030BA0115